MKISACLALSLALAAAGHGAGATAETFVSGSKLYKRCTSADTAARALCLGFVLGVVDAAPAILRCAPPSVTAQAIVEAVMLHLDRYPSDRAFPAHLIVRLAAREAWPCDP